MLQCDTWRHFVTTGPENTPRDGYLDAARECILDVGWRRTTLTEVARRAGVSRMTIYRAWPDMPTLLGDLMTREWTDVVAAQPDTGATADDVADGLLAVVRALRENELFVRIVELDPQLLLPYLLSRRGRSQEAIAAVLGARIREGQASGTVRAGDPDTLARALLLAAHGFVLSAQTMVDDDRHRVRTRRGAAPPRPTVPGPMNALRDRRSGRATGLAASYDVVVVGLGVTGAGVALDAASRGLRVLAVDAHDLAFGTSRWSSKLVHGGLRYLANGQVGIAHESAVERGILMEHTAPHLTHAMPMLLPLTSSVSVPQALLARGGFVAGDLLRRGARTSRETLPRPRRVSATEALALAPGLRPAGLRGGLVSWDGQLEDDARLVTTIARTAAAYGAVVRTRSRVLRADGRGVVLRDELTGGTREVAARAVVNATGVWAGDLDADVTLRPSRGTHLVLRAETLPGLRTAVTAPVPGSTSRFVLVLPQADGTVYVGLTDEPVEGPVPDVPVPTEPEIGFLLDVVSAAFAHDLRRDDVVGAFAGLRPLLDADGTTADLSRRHAVLSSRSGVVTVVGGKLTTYRRMAEDAVDRAVSDARLSAGPCLTHALPLLGAAPRAELAAARAPPATGPPLRHRGRSGDRHRPRGDGAPRRRAARAAGRPPPRDAGRAGLRRDPRGRGRRRGPAGPAYPDRPGARRPGPRGPRRRTRA